MSMIPLYNGTCIYCDEPMRFWQEKAPLPGTDYLLAHRHCLEAHERYWAKKAQEAKDKKETT